MTWFSGAAVYLIIWWLVFFMVLPFGARETVSDSDIAKGQFPGAPAKPHLLRKILICTAVSAVIYAGFHWAWVTEIISIRP